MQKRTRVWISVSLTLFVIIVIWLLFAHWTHTESIGNVTVGEAIQQDPKAEQPLMIITPYFKTTLPAGFSEKTRTESPGSSGTLLQLLAIGGTNRQQNIAITVGSIPSEGIGGVGDYNLRQSTPDSYERFSPPDLQKDTVAFRATRDTPGFVVFWTYDSRYYELNLSGSNATTLSQLQDSYLQIVNSWQDK